MTLSPTSWPGGGGGSYTPPTDLGIYGALSLGGTTIADGSEANLDWKFLEGAALFDLTDPTSPAVLTAGIYTVWAYADPFAAMTVDGFFELVLYMGGSAHLGSVTAGSRLATAARAEPVCAVSGTFYIPLGGGVALTCRNRDGAGPINFGIEQANVQRIT